MTNIKGLVSMALVMSTAGIQAAESANLRLRFTAGWGRMSPIVCLRTHSRWSHVDIVTDDGYLTSMPFKGVRYFNHNYIRPSREEVVELNIPAERVINEVEKRIGAKYDWSIWVLYSIGIKLPRRGWTCSGLVSSILGIGNDRTTPGQLYNLVRVNKSNLLVNHQ